MHALLLMTCVVVLGAESRTIQNARNLIENEWTEAYTYTQDVFSPTSQSNTTRKRTVQFCQMLSLREEDRWNSGVAWLIRHSEFEGEFSATAYKGFYRISHRSEQDVLIVSLGLTKKYTTRGPTSSRKDANWSLLTSFVPEGATFVLTMEPGNRVPEQRLEFSFERAYYVDEAGNETIRRSNPSTLTERITGTGAERRLRQSDFGTIGETIEMARGDVFAAIIPMKMPPTYRSRAPAPTPHTVLRPTPSAGANNPPKVEDPSRAVYKRGVEAFEKGEYDRAVTLLTAALELSPSLTEAVKWRGYAYYRLGDYVRSGRDLSEVIKRDPNDAFCYGARGDAYLRLGYFSRGTADYAERVRLRPDDANALNALAWTLATCADASVRDGSIAVMHAERACKLTDFKNAMFVDTLAAACAEAGDFVRAVRLQTVAVELAAESWKKAAEERLRCYENRKPWREDLRRAP